MSMELIQAPIKEELQAFEKHIDAFLSKIENENVRLNLQTFFKVRGKYLRPMLLLLSTGAISKTRTSFDDRLFGLALILELLHSASLVHDDIVDGDFERRGEKTINQVFGNKIAVLAGDTLFSYAFREATQHYEKEYNVPITNLALEMCMSELIQANKIEDKVTYNKVIRGKTAEFMGVACELGARYAGGSEADIEKLYQIGLNFGMTYQMIDDMIDGDLNALHYISREDIQKSYDDTKTLIASLDDSDYKTSFTLLLNYILEMNE